MWIGGEEGEYTEMWAGHKPLKISWIKHVNEFLQAGWAFEEVFFQQIVYFILKWN